MASLSLCDDGTYLCWRTGIRIIRNEDDSVKAIHPLSDSVIAVNEKGMVWDCYKDAVARLIEIDQSGHLKRTIT